MPIVHIPNAGSIGLNKDLSQHELPINAWSDASNVRFLDGYAWGQYGYGTIYGTPDQELYHLLPFTVGTTRYWLGAGLTHVYHYTKNSSGVVTETNITKTSDIFNYSATVNSWTSTLLGGLPILNNGVDPPQFYDLGAAAVIPAGGRLADLTAWPANTTCKSMRSFKTYLVAMNLVEDGTHHPFMIRTSNPADPGTPPDSWDYTDTAGESLRFDLADGYDPIMDGFSLRDSLMIYKEASIWRLDFTGGQFIHKASKVLGTSGALNRNCIIEGDGWQACLTASDFIVHDGQSPRSVLDKETRRWLFQNIDPTNIGAAFVFKNLFFNEVYACFPMIGSTKCDMAVVWNYKDDTCSIRTLPNINHACYGPVDAGYQGAFANDSAPFSTDTGAFDGPDFVPSLTGVLMAGSGPTIYQLDASVGLPDSSVVPSYIERRGLNFDQPEKIKLIKSIRPRIVGDTGKTITVKVGSQPDPWSEPEWSTQTHTIGTTVINDFLVGGRYIAVRFESDTAFSWRLDSYDIEYAYEGQY